jgi:hypothetical protein
MRLTLTIASLALACHPGAEAAGVPLYPNGATTRLPRSQIAQVTGPIAKIDGKDVAGQGGVFDLLPGCHLVELDRQLVADGTVLSSAVYWSGDSPTTLYALRMKPGARYVIRRQVYSDGELSGRIVLSAREEQADGAATDLDPAKSDEDIKACNDWAAMAFGR